MERLLEYVEIAHDNELQRKFNLLEREYSRTLNLHQKQLDNKVLQFPVEELNHKLDIAAQRFDAAKKGLGLINKLYNKNPSPEQRESKRVHRSRIMKNLNLLRMLLTDIIQQLSIENKDVVGSHDYENVDKDGMVKERQNLDDLHAEAKRPKGKTDRLPTRSGLNTSGDMDDNPFEGKARKFVKKAIKKITKK